MGLSKGFPLVFHTLTTLKDFWLAKLGVRGESSRRFPNNRMCSISGIVRGTGVAKMIACQKHRAPDESGIYKDAPLELGMGRLKIIDMKSPGLAPYREDEFVLSYNGEIFNYIELRKELEKKRWKFRTTSDTEVLMKSYREWGVKMFDKLNGMFAFALYDSKKKQILLARDIAGEKPLYYFHRGKTFAFCSEAKAFASVFPLEAQDNPFFDTFQHCFGTTLWKDVYDLPPAHYMLYDVKANTTKLVEYWKFQPKTIKLKTAVEELEDLIGDAVKIRLRSDVPVALYYSQGIDSSLLSTYHTFDHKSFLMTPRTGGKISLKHLGDLTRHLDFPVGSLSTYPLWKLAERASKHVKVVLSGEGADEVFGGYVRYLPIAREYELLQRYPSYQYIFGKYYPPYLDGFAKMTARNENVELAKEYIRPYFEMFADPISAMGFADFKLVMPSLLQMGDRMAGAFGLENRCPFLDRRVIEFGFSLPPELKISGLEQKLILRRVLEKRGLTAPLRDEKKGLTIRFNQWLGRKDWDRSSYVALLRIEWAKAFASQGSRRGAAPVASMPH
jgi:asparagine synthase (glutamine-hydrolysing)